MSEAETQTGRGGERTASEECSEGGSWRQWLVNGIADQQLQEAISLWLDSEGYDVHPLPSAGSRGLGVLATGASNEALAGEVWQAMRRAHPALTLTPLGDEAEAR